MDRSGEWDGYSDIGAAAPRLMQLPLHVLDPWQGKNEAQPFRLYTPKQLQSLVDNVKQNGIIEPICVRPKPDGRFEIIAGHNRTEAAKLAGMETIPALVQQLDDEAAAIMMVDSNLQHREKLLPSEKAFAYRLRLDSMKRQGQRTDLTSGQVGQKSESEGATETTCATVGHKSENPKSRDLLAAEVGVSREAVRKYIRLTYLIPELLTMVDAGTIKINQAVDLSYLEEEVQKRLFWCMEVNKIKRLNGRQCAELRQIGQPTEDDILRVLGIVEADDELGKIPSLTIKPDYSRYKPSEVQRLKKDAAYLEGIQQAILAFTDKYLQDRRSGGGA